MDLHMKMEKRQALGKKAKKLVDDGFVLGNVFGRGQQSTAVKGDYQTVNKIVHTAGKNKPIELEVGDDKHLVLVHEIDRDTITQRLYHVSFHIIKKGEIVHTEVPIRLIGDAPAERTGKIVVTILDHVEVEATPANIPEVFDLSAEVLVEEHDSISVGDIDVPEGVKILNDPELLIAKVDLPRAEIEEEEPEESELEADEVPSEHGSEEGDEEESSDEKSGSKETDNESK